MDKIAYIGLRNEARMEIIDYLNENDGFYLCDLHSIVFNEESHFSCYANAIETLNEEGSYQLFDTIGELIQYEKDSFGDVFTDFSNPCAIANMLWYIIGEEELYSMFDGCTLFYDLWNEKLSEKDCQDLVAWVREHGRN